MVVVVKQLPLNLRTLAGSVGACCVARAVSGAKITHLTRFCTQTGPILPANMLVGIFSIVAMAGGFYNPPRW